LGVVSGVYEAGAEADVPFGADSDWACESEMCGGGVAGDVSAGVVDEQEVGRVGG